MSFIEVMLSHKEVLFSLIAVVLILFIAVALAVMPALSRSLKRAAAQRKAKQAEHEAAQLKKKRAAQGKPAQRKRAVVVANQQQEATATVPADVPASKTEAPLIVAAANTEITPAAATPTEPEAQPAEAEASTDIQSILNAVFVDEESDSRYEVLLQDVDAISGAELLEMATRVAAALRAAQHRAV